MTSSLYFRSSQRKVPFARIWERTLPRVEAQVSRHFRALLGEIQPVPTVNHTGTVVWLLPNFRDVLTKRRRREIS